MTQEEKEKLQFNIAKFLKWKVLPQTDNKYFTKDDTWDILHLDDFDLDDWNRIMEVVEAIEKLNFRVEIISVSCIIYKNSDIVCSFYGIKNKISKKEAIVKAINQFLIWYNENNKS